MTDLRMRFNEGLDDEAEAVIATLIRRFDDWCNDHAPQRREARGSDFRLLLDWKINYGDGCLDLWSIADVDEFVLNWCPRKVSAAPEWARPMVATVATGFLFLDDQGLLAHNSDSGERLAARTRSLEGECVERMGDSSNFGMAKSLFAGMGVDDSDGLSPDTLQSVIEQFNALPYEQRAQITDGAQPNVPVIGPVLMPTAQEVAASAAVAPVLVGFLALSDYFQAPGRPLTATGNIKLADAAALSEILGTEPLTEEVGDRTFHRQSAAQMPALDHWQWWAREVGVLRRSKSNLVAVKAWRDRVTKDPVGQARKAFAVLHAFGLISSYRTHAYSHVNELMDNASVALLATPLETGGEVDFGDMVDVAQAIRTNAGAQSRWGNERTWIIRDVELILEMAERAGIVEQHDVVYEQTRLGKQRAGGTITLTPFGVLTIVEAARAEGVTVETLDPPEDLSAEALADLLGQESVDMGTWWDLLRRWLAAQPQPQQEQALAALLAGLDDDVLCLVLLYDTPDDLVDVFATVLREAFETGGQDDPVPVIAFGWLAQLGQIAAEDMDFEVVQRSRLSLVGMLAAVEPETLTESWSGGRPQPELLAEIGVISRTMPRGAVKLLEAIGKHFPDKAVAKSARREALKVRSRLANQR